MISRLILVFVLIVTPLSAVCEVTGVSGSDAIAAGKKVKASVTGTGKTKFFAEAEAASAARDVAGGSYSTVRKKTTGSGNSWTCTMTIEYTQKD